MKATLAERAVAVVRRHPLASYFVLVYALTWGGVLGIARLLTTSGAAPSPAEVGLVALPMLFAPGLAALALTALAEGRPGVRSLWARLSHWRVGPRAYALAICVMPLLVLAILHALSALVSPVYAPTLALMGLAGLLAGYLEEIGWTGYATPRLLARWSPLRAGLLLGALWGLWHALADHAIRGATLGAFWPVAFGLFVLPLVAWRVMMTMAYARWRSGVVAQLMHFAYTGSLGAFIPLAALSPAQDAWIYAILAGMLWLGVAGLVFAAKRLGQPTTRARAQGAWTGR